MLIYLHQFFLALVFSCVIESAVIFFLASVFKKRKIISLLAIFGTMFTIPYVWYVFPTLFWYNQTLVLVFGESFAFIVEACIYKYFGKISWKQAILFSFLANMASYYIWKLF